MKIGVMLRHLDQHGGGALVYTQNLLGRLLAMDTANEYVLVYRNAKWIGTYGDGERIREVAAPAPSALIWDQLVVPRVMAREGVDLIFNPKFSLPLLSAIKGVWVCHGLDWYVMPWGSKWVDRLSHRFLIPRYAQKSEHIIAVSETARQHVIEYLGVDEDRVHTVYLGVDEAFGEQMDLSKLQATRKAYGLPDRFFLYCGQIYPPKNFGRLIKAYAKVGPELGVSLVVAGTHTWGSEHEVALIDQLGLNDWVRRLGWVDRETLPALYAQAEALVLPSLYESFGVPILEAMASGTPVVTANRYGTAELAQDAAVLVDPEDVESIAYGMRRVIKEETLRRQITAAGYRRVKDFAWERCARETLNVLERAASPRRELVRS